MEIRIHTWMDYDSYLEMVSKDESVLGNFIVICFTFGFLYLFFSWMMKDPEFSSFFSESLFYFSVSELFVIIFSFGFFYLILLLIFQIIFPKDILHKSSRNNPSSDVNKLKEKSYAELQIPRSPPSDRDYLAKIVFGFFVIIPATIYVTNAIRFGLVATWGLLPTQFFTTHVLLLYLINLFCIIPVQIIWLLYSIKIFLTQNRVLEQLEFENWLKERDIFYSEFENRKDLQSISDPSNYFLSFISQYLDKKDAFRISTVVKLSLLLSSPIFVMSVLALSKIIYILLIDGIIFTVFFIFFFFVERANSRSYKKPIYKRIGEWKKAIEATLTGDVVTVCKEIKEKEDYKLNWSNQGRTSFNTAHIFWILKSRLLMIAGENHDASIILQAMHKELDETYLLRSEVAYLLSQCYQKLNKVQEAEELLSEVRIVFSQKQISLDL